MGHHYIPQYYLRHFGTLKDHNYIWMYDKSTKEFKHLPIRNVAQSGNFYKEEDECTLNEYIESPAKDPLDKLRNRQLIDIQDRKAITRYLESMIKRVPHTRRKILKIIPQAKDIVLNKIKEKPEEWAPMFNLTQKQVIDKTNEFDRKFDNESLSIKNDMVRRQWSSEDVLDLIFSMTWRIIKADDSHHFLTSDNPVFFDETCGLKHREAEVSFPLASDTTLHGSWQGPRKGLLFVQAKPPLVKEINRRVASVAERFIFYYQKAEWISTVSQKRRPRLSQIRWQPSGGVLKTV